MNIIRRSSLILLLVFTCSLVIHNVRSDDGDLPVESTTGDPTSNTDANPDGGGADGEKQPGEGAVEISSESSAEVAAQKDVSADPSPEEQEKVIPQEEALQAVVEEVTTAVAELELVTKESPAAAPVEGVVAAAEDSQPTTAAQEQQQVAETAAETTAAAVAEMTTAAAVETTQLPETTTTTPAITTTPFVDTVERKMFNERMNGSVVTIKLSRKLSPQERQKLIQAIKKRLNANPRAMDAKRGPPKPSDTNVTQPVTNVTPPVTSETAPDTPKCTGAECPSRRRRRNTDDKEFDDKDLVVLEGEGDEQTLGLVVATDDGGSIPADLLESILKEEEQQVEQELTDEKLDVQIDYIKAGRPDDVRVGGSTGRGEADIHYGLLITIIVIISVCLFAFFFCCFCVRCCPRQPVSSEKTPMALEEGRRSFRKQPIVMSSPFTDEELVKGEAGSSVHSAPPSSVNNQSTPPKRGTTPRGSMREKADQSQSRNGGGQHISKGEEDFESAIVPLDQLSKAERNQVDVENTKF